jgi:RNA polymerase sigma-70 factor (ECF subfamily)
MTDSPLRDESQKLAAFDQHRGLLLSVAYRMLGSVADAEDMVQETFIRWQQSTTEEVQSPRAFLVTIVSRLCINYLQSARVQREQYVGQWLPEPFVAEFASDPLAIAQQDEFLSMAFLLLLERLNPVERAVFLLREVFDYGYGEISAILDQSEANCRQILRRARQHLLAARPRFKVSDGKRRELLERFVLASGSGNLDGLLEVLEEDVVLYSDGGGKTFAVPNPVFGARNVARAIVMGQAKFLPRGPMVSRKMYVNGRPGVVSYLAGRPLYVLAIETRGERISSIYFVTNPDKLSRVPGLDVNESVSSDLDNRFA